MGCLMSNIIGLDVGTMNIVSQTKTENGKNIQIKKIRNMFLPLEKNIVEYADIQKSDIEYLSLSDDDKYVIVIGEDQYKLSNIFNKQVKRTMKKGIIQQDEISQMDILMLMVSRVQPKIDNTVINKCVYSIPQEPIDVEDAPSVLYHEQVFSKILKTLGYNAESLNESMQIIFSECKQENYSGIAISFGQGLTNICCQYKGTPTLQFSIHRGGDWIDYNQQKSVGQLESRVTFIKENRLDLINLKEGKNKQENRIKEQIQFFYNNMISYTLDKIIEKFNKDSENLFIDDEIPIIVSGGTSTPNGFLELFKSIFGEYNNFPYTISEIRTQKDQLNQVQEGCMLYQNWKDKKGDGK